MPFCIEWIEIVFGHPWLKLSGIMDDMWRCCAQHIFLHCVMERIEKVRKAQLHLVIVRYRQILLAFSRHDIKNILIIIENPVIVGRKIINAFPTDIMSPPIVQVHNQDASIEITFASVIS